MQDTRPTGTQTLPHTQTPHVELHFSDVAWSAALARRAEEKATRAISHLGWTITRVDVHFADDSSPGKHTPNDKRCTMEARPAGKQPVAVEGRADDWFAAVDAAAGKLKRALEHRLRRQAA